MDELLRMFDALARLETASAASPPGDAGDRDDAEPSTAELADERPFAPIEQLRLHARALEEACRIQRAYLRWIEGPREPSDAGNEHDRLTALLIRIRHLFLRHPLAAQEAFGALMAEGRQFAQTPEGQRWQRRLTGSTLVRRGRRIWDVLSIRMFEDEAATVVPSSFVDALFHSVRTPELEQLLLRVQGVSTPRE